MTKNAWNSIAVANTELRKQLSSGKSIRDCLHGDMPIVLEARKAYYVRAASRDLFDLAEKTQKGALKYLDINTLDLDQDLEFARIFDEHKTSPLEEIRDLAANIQEKKRKYDEVDIDLRFLQEDLLPTLTALEKAEMPTRMHLIDLNRACGNEELNMPGLNFHANGEYIPKYLRIDEKSSESIKSALTALRDEVQAEIQSRKPSPSSSKDEGQHVV